MTSSTSSTTASAGAASTAAAPDAPFALDASGKRVFVGLMLGMLVASISQTIVSPAMPRIVAELGGMEHYSWLATSAMLVSAITVPIVGKLSDLYGRRPFYLAGLLIFMLGSVLSGMSTNFWFLVFGRAVQGIGMGTLMPLSQTIIGDIIPPRARGKYQGLMGAIFGVSSIVGPLVGGFVTDHWGWRWLFYISLPVGVIAFGAIWRFLHLDHERRDARIDWAGIVVLSGTLLALLLATSLGGATWAWDSAQIIGLYVGGTLGLLLFIWIETKAAEPVIPLRLFRSSVFTFSNVASFGVSMLMFGALIYIPVYAQGVLGVDATQSGLILMPMSVTMIGLSIIAGLLITRTGRYKEQTLAGILVLGLGYWMLTRLHYGADPLELTLAMVVLGAGLGMAMQVYTLVVQNVVPRADLGVATAATQFFRNVGSTIGIAVFGTIMTSEASKAIATHLPPQAAGQMPSGGMNAGSVLDPATLAKLPTPIVNAVRMGLADALHEVFTVGLPIVGLVLVATLLIKSVPLRDTLGNVTSGEEAGRELLDGLGQSSPDEDRLALGSGSGPTRTKERVLGLQLQNLAVRATGDEYPLLRQAVADLGGGDLARGIALLERTAHMFLTEDQHLAAKAEPCALEVAQADRRRGGVLSVELRDALTAAAAEIGDAALTVGEEPTVQQRYEAVDVDALGRVGNDLTAALLVDLHRSRQ
nr:MDR family MFS transporter [Mobilicoccus massiliensis]